MRVIVFLFALCLLITGCESSRDVEIDKSLKSKLEKIISSYEQHVNKRIYNPPIYEVTFKEYDRKCYLIINTNNIYNEDLDGFISLKNKLITFNNTSSECNSDFVKVNTKPDTGKLSEYSSDVDNSDIYDPAYWEFEINGHNLILKKQNRLKIDFE